MLDWSVRQVGLVAFEAGGGTGYQLEGKQSGRHIQAALGDVRMMEVFTLSVGRGIQQRWAQGGPAICRDPLEGEGKGKKEEVPQPGSDLALTLSFIAKFEV